MKTFKIYLVLITWLGICTLPLQLQAKRSSNTTWKPRIVILTDIAPTHIEPDDMESMIRLLAHADLLEIEGIIASSGFNSSGGLYPVGWMDSLQTCFNAYERDLPNLMKRSNQTSFFAIQQENKKQAIGYWPSANYLRQRAVLGSLGFGYKMLGENNHSQGSELIIKLADEADERPLWIAIWGGGNTLAQALWKIKQERTEKEVDKFLNKLRVYAITDQDVPWDERNQLKTTSHYWMRKTFGKDLFFIWDESAWLSQNGLGRDNWQQYVSHIQRHGYLGRIYPKCKWGVEGDTPSFLYLLPNGLSIPDQCKQGSWGGYFEWHTSPDGETECYTNASTNIKTISQKYERYFYDAIFNNFAARMDWAEYGKGNRNPIVIINKKGGLQPVKVKANAGKSVILNAGQSHDPDGDELTFKWWILPEAGTYKKPIELKNSRTSKLTFTLPEDLKNQELHIICEVTDQGTPKLTSYRRIIIR